MTTPDILYAKASPLAFLTLNRPEMRNAFTIPMIEGLLLGLEEAKKDPEVRVLIIQGEGGAFSAGGNIKEMAEGKLVSWNMKKYLWEHVQRVPLALEDFEKPVIASIDGPAFGGGFGLALACDLRVCSHRATFCSTFARIGLAPGDGEGYFLPRLVGLGKALDILLTGRVIYSEEALRIGIVDRVVPSETLDRETINFGREIAQWPLVSLQAIKRSVYGGLASDLRTHLDHMSSQLALLTEREEHRQAIEKLIKAL
jgi:enoyl-CoA hydratase/carnithine racemase